MSGRARLGISLLLSLVAIYGAIKAWPLLSGPSITVTTLSADPVSGLTKLSGIALHTETLLLNGGTLLIDEAGNFDTTLTLPRGSGILTLSATDRFGRTTSEQKPIITP